MALTKDIIIELKRLRTFCAGVTGSGIDGVEVKTPVLLDRQFFSTGQPMIGKNLIGFFQSFDEKLRQVILY